MQVRTNAATVAGFGAGQRELRVLGVGMSATSERPGTSHADDSRAREGHPTLSSEKIIKINIPGRARVDKRRFLCSETYILFTKAQGFRVKRSQICSGLI